MRAYRGLTLDQLLQVWREDELRRVLNAPTVFFHNAHTPILQQWRWYDNDGGANASTSLENESTSHEFDVSGGNVTAQLRVLVEETGDDTSDGNNAVLTFEYDINNSGTWTQITESSTAVQYSVGSNLTSGTDTTNRATNGLTDEEGTFVAGEEIDSGSSVTITNALTAGNFHEHHIEITFIASQLANGDSVTFRAVYDGGAIPNTGTGGTPTATIAAATTATGAQTLPSISQSGTGAEEFIGSGAQTLPSISQSGSGSHVQGATATGAQTLPSLTQQGTGKHYFDGTGAQTLPSVAQSGTGVMQPSGTGAQTLPAVVQSGTGEETISGTGGQTLPAITQQASALHREDLSGTGGQTLPAIAQAGNGSLGIYGFAAGPATLDDLDALGFNLDNLPMPLDWPGWASPGPILPSIVQEGSNAATVGTGAQTLPSIAQQGTGAEKMVATGGQTLPSVTQAGSGAQEFTGTGAQTLAALTQQGTGVMHPEGAGAQTLPPITQQGSAALVFTGTAQQTLAALTQQGSGVEIISGQGALTLAAIAQSGAGVEIITGTGANTLPAVTQSGTGVMQPSGVGGLTLAAITQQGSGEQATTATGAQTLAAITQAGTGAIPPQGVGGQTLPAVTQQATGAQPVSGTGAQTLPSIVVNQDGGEVGIVTPILVNEYPGLHPIPVDPDATALVRVLRQLSLVIGNILVGKVNNTGVVVLTPSAAQTTVIDERMTLNSVLYFDPMSANAAAELMAGTMYVLKDDRSHGQFIVTHANNTQTDRTFRYEIKG